MNNTFKTTLSLLIALPVAFSMFACTNPDIPKASIVKVPVDPTESTTTSDDTDASTEDTTAVDAVHTTAFKEANLIKIGEHTYYPDYLFDKTYLDEDRINAALDKLEGADPTLHDDIVVYAVLESEYKDEYRFCGRYIVSGVILEEAEMMAWYDESEGYVWDIDVSRFRRCDPILGNFTPIEEICDTVYAAALEEKGEDMTGTYVKKCDDSGIVYYEFTIDKYSTVDVYAQSGMIFFENYWDGTYT